MTRIIALPLYRSKRGEVVVMQVKVGSKFLSTNDWYAFWQMPVDGGEWRQRQLIVLRPLDMASDSWTFLGSFTEDDTDFFLFEIP